MKGGVNRNAVRWAPMVEAAVVDQGLDPKVHVPHTLARIARESSGNPGVRQTRTNAIGLGQQFQYIEGQAKPYRPDESPFVHPDAEIGGFKVSWNPADQIRAAVGLPALYQSRHNANLAAALWAYASGARAVQDAMSGAQLRPTAVHHRDHYVPGIAEDERLYSQWYLSWEEAGRPTVGLKRFKFDSPDGPQAFEVMFADVEAVELLDTAYPSPFADGKYRFKSYERDMPPLNLKTRGITLEGRPQGEIEDVGWSSRVWGMAADWIKKPWLLGAGMAGLTLAAALGAYFWRSD